MSKKSRVIKPSDEQSTPQALFDKFNGIHKFTLDSCANALNHKCDLWYGPQSPLGIEDALAINWPTLNERLWMNPPYSRGLQREFVEKAIECAYRGGYVIGLLPADTSTRLFHELIWGKWPIEFIKGRQRFERPDKPGRRESAKFGSMIVEFIGASRREVHCGCGRVATYKHVSGAPMCWDCFNYNYNDI